MAGGKRSGRGELPAGTVTMLFSDMEGSTRLLARLGDGYGDLLSAQRGLQREAFGRHNGTELGTEGDSFFVVFGSAADAVAACAEAQRSLAGRDWPGGAVPRIRMGLHTGEPTRHDDGYIGMDVHRAARIAAAAHGGQVVMSDATWQLAAAKLPGTRAADLGWHRLKDIAEPEHLHQLLIDGLPPRFPPLRSLGQRGSLPEPPAPLLGRDTDLAAVTELAGGAGAARIVTLTGPGGVGKSRLALAVARAVDHRFADGVYFVPLATVQEAPVMWTTIAESLGVTGDGRSPPTFFEHIAGRQALLILDNLEQLPAAGQVVADLAAAAPRLTVLATSRRPLRIPGEHEYPVGPLPVRYPASQNGSGDGAVELFAQYARMVRPDFTVTAANAADVVAICTRLDGLPLALELAAARVRLLSPKALLARLGGSLEFEAGSAGRPDRHRTLRDTIRWSYDLLDPGPQAFFRRIAVFSGGADLAAVQAVVDGQGDVLESIAALTEAGLAVVTNDQDGEPRLGLLQTIRDYALDRLTEAGEQATARAAHASYYAELAEAVAPDLQGPRPLAARDRLETELDNIRAALAWCLGPRAGAAPDPAGTGPAGSEPVALGLRLCQAMSWFWYARGYTDEGRDWQRRAAAAAASRGGPDLALALHGLAVLLLQQGEVDEASDALQTCLGIWREQGNQSRVAMELCSLGVARWTLGDLPGARALLQESIDLAHAIGEPDRESTALGNLGVLEVHDNHPERATELLEQALAIDVRLGRTWASAVVRANLAGALLRAGRVPEAYGSLREHAAGMLAFGDIELTIDVIELLAAAFAQLGDPPRAAWLLGSAEALREQAGMPRTVPDRELMAEFTGAARAAVSAEVWDEQYQAGRAVTPAEALAAAVAAGPSG
jgi:predicted ATPase/class 3 adenylate cyclase